MSPIDRIFAKLGCTGTNHRLERFPADLPADMRSRLANSGLEQSFVSKMADKLEAIIKGQYL